MFIIFSNACRQSGTDREADDVIVKIFPPIFKYFSHIFKYFLIFSNIFLVFLIIFSIACHQSGTDREADDAIVEIFLKFSNITGTTPRGKSWVQLVPQLYQTELDTISYYHRFHSGPYAGLIMK